jgi:hypothetical protein
MGRRIIAMGSMGVAVVVDELQSMLIQIHSPET